MPGSRAARLIAITRRADGYNIVQVENSAELDPPNINGKPLGPKAVELSDNDVIEIIGIKMGFFAD